MTHVDLESEQRIQLLPKTLRPTPPARLLHNDSAPAETVSPLMRMAQITQRVLAAASNLVHKHLALFTRQQVGK